MKNEIHLEQFYPYPVARIWECLTNPGILREWSNLNKTVPFEARVGFTCTETAKPRPGWDGNMYFEVLEVIPEQKLVYSFRGGPEPGVLNLDTIVIWSLVHQEGGTLLKLDHTGFTGLRGAMTSFMMEKGWQKSFFRRLEVLLNQSV